MKENIGHPNIIFIISDDLGYGDIACYGNKIVQTPNLDQLAKDGAQLNQHYSAAPICAASRAGILTGRYHHRTGGVDVPSNRGFDRICLNESTIGDAFTNIGYSTGYIGKWHSGLHDLCYHPNARGFREFVGFLNGGMDYWKWVLDYNGLKKVNDGRYLTDVFTEESLLFIERHKNDPFFLHLSYNAPHGPMQAPQNYLNKYSKNDLTDNVALTYAMIECMDDGLGQIVKKLKETHLEKKTIIFFTSDNGPYLCSDFSRYNGPFRGMKYDVLEGGIRVPGIIKWPGKIQSNYHIDEMIDSIDWFPTFLDICGAKDIRNYHLDGQSIKNLLLGKTSSISRKRFWQFNRYDPIPYTNGCMRDGKWKLYWPMRKNSCDKDNDDNHWYRTGLLNEHKLFEIDKTLPERKIGEILDAKLFNLDEDPMENIDLSKDYPKIKNNMIKQWNIWWDELMHDYQISRNLNLKWLR